jgi:hypothetical protein
MPALSSKGDPLESSPLRNSEPQYILRADAPNVAVFPNPRLPWWSEGYPLFP